MIWREKARGRENGEKIEGFGREAEQGGTTEEEGGKAAAASALASGWEIGRAHV